MLAVAYQAPRRLKIRRFRRRVRACSGAADQRPAGQARRLSLIGLSGVRRPVSVSALPQTILGTSGRQRVKLAIAVRPSKN